MTQCPVMPKNLKEGPVVVPGTQMVLGARVIKTWNATTKKWEWMSRPGIAQGTGGEKVFRGNPTKLL